MKAKRVVKGSSSSSSPSVAVVESTPIADTGVIVLEYPSKSAPWDEVVCFVATQGYASVQEIMQQWCLPAPDAVHVMDRLEAEGICETIPEYLSRGGMGPRLLKD